MEQQSVSIAKSGMVTSLRSRAAVLAAANPVGGHYNKRKSVCENLKMNSALLSRFGKFLHLLHRALSDTLSFHCQISPSFFSMNLIEIVTK